VKEKKINRHAETEETGGRDIYRLSFEPYVKGLNESLQRGIPIGSWVMLFGNSGSYKTLHALAFALAGIMRNEKVVYVSTEQDWKGLKAQVSSLGWSFKAYDTHLTIRLLEKEKDKDNDIGAFDLVWIDLDSLRYLAWKLNDIERKEKENSRRKKYWFYDDPNLLTFAIVLGLEVVGSIKRKETEITLDQVEKPRIKEGFYKSSYSLVDIKERTPVRIIIDSINGRWNSVGKALTSMKIKLESPLYTFLLTTHTSRTYEEEMEAQVGYIVDGMIRLWNEMTEEGGRVTGWIAKMKLTDHSRLLHNVRITGGETKHIEWLPITNQ